MDTFSTQSLASARVILSQSEAIDNSVYCEYNPATLNISQAAINETLAADYPTSLGYLWATPRCVQRFGSLWHQRLCQL